MNAVDIEKAEREVMRWRILQVLNAGRPMPVSEMIVLRALHDSHQPVTASKVRIELDYLSDRKLVTITGLNSPVWSAELTRLGVDLVEYTVDCDPGIARPPKWF